MASVKLVKPYRNYNPGELADFGEALNQLLLDKGIAQPGNGKGESKKPGGDKPQGD